MHHKAAFKRSRPSIHRILIKRLLLFGLVLSIVAGTGTFIAEYLRLSQVVVNDTLKTLELKLQLLQPLLDRPQFQNNNAAFEHILSNATSSCIDAQLGQIKYVRLLDPSGSVFFRKSSRNFADHAMLDRLFAEFATTAGDSSELQSKIVGVAPAKYILLRGVLNNSDKQPVAAIEGAFLLSPDAVGQIRINALRFVALAVCIVILTTALLYPTIISLMNRQSRLAGNLMQANLEIVKVLGGAIAERDSETNEHNYRVTIAAVKIAEAMGAGNNPIRRLIKGAFLHDVGKIGVPDNILLKHGKLTDEEFLIMKRHVDHGIAIVSRSDWLQDAAEVVAGHHEKINGDGYPKGLKGKEIPLTARIFAIADVFDALTAQRPYKAPLSFEEAIALMDQAQGTHFDAEIYNCFKNIAASVYRDFQEMDYRELVDKLQEIIERYFVKEFHEVI